MGRDTKYTPAIHNQIVEALRFGAFRKHAANAAGVGDRTLADWIAWGEAGREPYATFARDVEAAIAEAAIRDQSIITKAAIGKHALELTRDHLWNTTLGKYSPFHRLAEMGGYIMLLGCDHNSNSTIHVAESLAEPAFNYLPTATNPQGKALIRQRDGKVKEIQLTEFTGCSQVFNRAEEPLRRAGVIRDGKVGHAAVQLMQGLEVLGVLVPLLKEKPGFLLCDNPDCEFCPQRRELLKRLAGN